MRARRPTRRSPRDEARLAARARTQLARRGGDLARSTMRSSSARRSSPQIQREVQSRRDRARGIEQRHRSASAQAVRSELETRAGIAAAELIAQMRHGVARRRAGARRRADPRADQNAARSRSTIARRRA